jgi:hypothetical protein
MRNSKVSFLLIAALLCVPGMVFGQAQTGSVSGVVLDPTDALIPGAKCTLKSAATGTVREIETSSVGTFRFDLLLPGIYHLTITKEGFQALQIPELDVRPAKNTDLGNLKMAVGDVGQVVQIEASTAPLVETQNAQITSTFSTRQINALKQGFGQGIDSLAILTPGVVPGLGNINSGGMLVAANGQRARSTQFMIDGHQMNDITIGGPSFFFNNFDMIGEYQVITNQFSAEYGRNLGATVSIITKGGSNELHGSLYWLHFDNGLASKTSLQSRNNLRKPVLVNNQWGVNVGGPAVRDRLFWYGAYRGIKQPGSLLDVGTIGTSAVITPAGIQTLLARFPNSRTLQLYRDVGPMAKPSLDGSLPTCVPGSITTRTLAGVPGVEVCASQRARPSNTNFWEYNARVDYVGKRHTLMGKYLVQKNEFCCSGSQNGYWWAVPNKNLSVGVTHTFQISPRQVNYFRFNYGAFDVQFEGANTEPISNVRANLANFAMPSGYLGFGLPSNLPQNRLLDNFQIQNNWSISFGRHYLKAGIEFQRNYTQLFFLPFINGGFGFQDADLTDFVNNTPNTVNFTAGNGSFQPRETDQFYYIQNDWRIRPNFTINMGLRYEHNGQPINRAVDEILARESNPATAFWLQSVPLEGRTFPRIPNDNNNFAPRIGFAYTPYWAKWLFGEGKTVIRGGYGMAYELAFYNILLNMTTAAPRVFAFALTRTAGTAIPVPGSATGNDVANAIPTPVNSVDPRGLAQTRITPDFHNPYGQNWSLGIQREIGRTQVVEIRYVGTNGIGLFQSRNANPLFSRMVAPTTLAALPFGVASAATPTPTQLFGGVGTVTLPGFPQFVLTSPLFPSPVPCASGTGAGRVDCAHGAVRERINSARSNYNSLQVRYDIKNWKNQFTGGAAYTYSRGIDNVSEIFGFFGDGSIAFAQNPFDLISGERGVSNQNLKQTLALHYIWSLPWFRAQSGFIGRVLGGWQVSGITTFLSGRPWTPIQNTGNRWCGQDSGFNAFFAGLQAVCRPFSGNAKAPLTVRLADGTIIPNVGYFSSAGTLHRATTPGSPRLSDPVVSVQDVRFIFNDDNAVRFFSPNNPFGVGRNNFYGDYNQNWDIAIDKTTKATERIDVRFRMTMANAFNRRNFGVPPSLLVTSGDFALPNRANVAGRSIRFGMWVNF